MRMKSKIFTSFLLAAVLLSGCKKDDPAPDKATLSVSPQTARCFTARAKNMQIIISGKTRHREEELQETRKQKQFLEEELERMQIGRASCRERV